MKVQMSFYAIYILKKC